MQGTTIAENYVTSKLFAVLNVPHKYFRNKGKKQEQELLGHPGAEAAKIYAEMKTKKETYFSLSSSPPLGKNIERTTCWLGNLWKKSNP